MKKNLTIIFVALASIILKAQSDTIYVNEEKIIANVKEITEDGVKFTYPNEELLNTLYKNSVNKIVFKTGRVQTFNESSSFKTITNFEDYEKVTITQVQSEVLGLNKIGDVSSKAVGTTVISNSEKVKDRAYNKLKMQAAMQGANIIYLTDMRSQGNKWGGYYGGGQKTETSLTGVAYSNKVLNFNEFDNLISGKSEFIVTNIYELRNSSFDIDENVNPKLKFLFEKIENDNNSIYIWGKVGEQGINKRYKLSRFSNDEFSLYSEEKKSVMYYTLKI